MLLSTTVNYINNALNYPSIALDDIRLYFNQALAELNTSLHIHLPSLEQMELNSRDLFQSKDNIVLLEDKPQSNTEIPSKDLGAGEPYYYDKSKKMYGVLKGTQYVYFPNIVGIYNDYANGPCIYESFAYSEDLHVWYSSLLNGPTDFDLNEYLPDDWVLLFLIPYICFKYAVKDGDTGALFNDEFSEGYKQLRNSYTIPVKVNLKSCAHHLAYKEDVKNNIDNLDINVPTKAIFDTYSIRNGIPASYESVYEGGWVI